MNNDNQQDSKKGFSNNIVWFLIAAIILAMLVQNFVDTNRANVSFSHQLEHLVNLEMIQPESSKKIAIKENLTTFSGKFRDHLTDEGKNRYKYLELLEANHELSRKKIDLSEELQGMQAKIKNAAEYFLELSGYPIPKGGYIVIDEPQNVGEQNLSVIIHEIPTYSFPNLTSLLSRYEKTISDPNPEQADALGSDLMQLVSGYRSSKLGIGNETMKRELREYSNELQRVLDAKNISLKNRLQIYGNILTGLQTISSDLNSFEETGRLSKLRSVRNYQSSFNAFQSNQKELENNISKLDRVRQDVGNVLWYFNNQEISTRLLEKKNSEEFQQWFTSAKKEWENFNRNRGETFKAPDQPLNTVLKKTFKSEETPANYLSYLFTFLPLILIGLALYFLFARQMKGMGGNAMSFGKSPAKLLNKSSHKVTFKEVAGLDEEIEELQEIVDFLKNPKKFTILGGRIPKGVLCVGPPGTGKTLIAKAVAGEADRPFFSISGSDFVEMFVGVGASRIRDLFEQAKRSAPCIVFIDEIDAVGRHRGAGIGGGHDEREQTLNQLLVEMDGFDTNEGVILMAATNRPDILDKALLRPGRFDRRIILSLPDIKGRFEILKVHARKIKLDPTVDLMKIARSTPGSSGADLENLLNEAALIAARKGRSAVTEADTTDARDKVLYGKERRSLEMDEAEKTTTAYHESGHAVVGLIVENADPVDKVTIIPRGMSLGSTMFLPKKNRLSYWKRELVDQLAVLMGGRCAEEVFVHDISSGAQQDIDQATKIARSMVCEWGMSEKLGTVAYDERTEAGQYLGMASHHEKRYSEDTAKAIDEEVKIILEAAHERAKKIIQEHHHHVDVMAKMLIEFETLDSEDVRLIMDDKWDMEEKRAKIKEQDELHRKMGMDQPTTPPPPPEDDTSESKKKSDEPPASPMTHDLRA